MQLKLLKEIMTKEPPAKGKKFKAAAPQWKCEVCGEPLCVKFECCHMVADENRAAKNSNEPPSRVFDWWYK